MWAISINCFENVVTSMHIFQNFIVKRKFYIFLKYFEIITVNFRHLFKLNMFYFLIKPIYLHIVNNTITYIVICNK